MQKLLSFATNPHFMAKFHAFAVIFWVVMIVPTVLWWKESITYLVFISVWALISAHMSAYQAAHSEVKQDEQ